MLFDWEGVFFNWEYLFFDKELFLEILEKCCIYSFDDVVNFVEDGVEYGVFVVEILDCLLKMNVGFKERVLDV